MTLRFTIAPPTTIVTAAATFRFRLTRRRARFESGTAIRRS